MGEERIYIEGDEARFTRTGLTSVDLEFSDGRKFTGLEPRRLFPMTGVSRYITLLDGDGVEVAVIRNLASLPEAERETVEACLYEYYRIPKVERILGCTEKFGMIRFRVETDRGECTIEIHHIVHQIKLTYGIRVLFLDNDDNRYEIPDIRKLDRKSRAILENYI